jgi:uncharacterized protein YjiS (DUF1127 family)
MEMHTPESLHATHGIVVQPRPRGRSSSIKLLLAMCFRMRLVLRREREIRRAAAELESLSEHMLNDIGITRTDIKHVVRRSRSPFWRRSEGAPC